MSKAIIQGLSVLNYITKSLTNTENDYFIGNSEWSDGTRSDVVLEPKSSDIGLSIPGKNQEGAFSACEQEQ